MVLLDSGRRRFLQKDLSVLGQGHHWDLLFLFYLLDSVVFFRVVPVLVELNLAEELNALVEGLLEVSIVVLV
jgi:hypothetical protein